MRSLKGFAFDKAFPDAWRVAGGEMCVLESFCQFEVLTHIKNIFFFKSLALVDTIILV